MALVFRCVGCLLHFTQLLWSVLPVYVRGHLHRRHTLALEIVALRSQLAVLQGRVDSGKRPRPQIPPWFRALWAMLCRVFPGWRDWLAVVQPQTVVRWHREAGDLLWRKRSGRVGRPPLEANMAKRVQRLARENPTWGGQRVVDELALLGFEPPHPDTIRKYMKNARKDEPDPEARQRWLTFLHNHLGQAWAMDFCMVRTLSFQPLFVFAIIVHGTREIVHFNVTDCPTAAWVTQQLREATGWDEAPRFLHCDNDPVFKGEVAAFLDAIGIEKVPTAPRSPWQNPFIERFFGNLRRELLDHVIPFNQRHLMRLLNEYIRFYNTERPSQALDGLPPVPTTERDGQAPPGGPTDELVARPVCGGLHHVYSRRKAA